MGKTMTNIMDKWILSELQSLVKYFREEMEAYRLYTVLPKLLNFIDLLCNTYVRMNRQRIRGQTSKEDALCSTQALFTVLLTLCQLMAPLCPFIVETMYINLRNGLGENSELSVHFMQIPECNEDAIDLDIERRVQSLIHSIKLGRYVRERNKLKTKLPLAELMVVHQNEQFLKDVEGLKQYILTELNVKKVSFSNEMADYIRLSGEPEYKSLGEKFKKKTGKISKKIKQLTHNELLELVNNGEIEICEEKIDQNDIKVIWNFEGDSKKWAFKEGDGAIVLMDQRITKKLKDEGTAREICNRIQKLRKLGNLVPADVVNAFYNVQKKEEEKNDDDQDLVEVFEDFSDLIEKHTRIKVMPFALKSEYVATICSEINDVEGKMVEFALCAPQLFLNLDQKQFKDQNERDQIEKYLQSQDINTLKQTFPDKIKFNIDDKHYELEVGKDVFYKPDGTLMKRKKMDIDYSKAKAV